MRGIVRMARHEHVEGVVCGHIHTPIVRDIQGLPYYNTGDWVESTSALVEEFDGSMKLITHFEVEVAQGLHPADFAEAEPELAGLAAREG